MEMTKVQEETADLLKLSFHAYTGEITPETMKLQGMLNRNLIQILVDSGSTNNFLDTALAKKLDIQPQCFKALDVIVANGARLHSLGRCNNLKWQSQGHQLETDFHLLPLKEYDMVLGIQWLRTFGPILWDFEKLLMSFKINGIEVQLKGATEQPLQLVDSNTMAKTVTK